MATALFISEDYVKQQSIIDENVDVKLIRPTIIDCQNVYLQSVLGTSLFEDLNTKIVAGTTNADEDVLLQKYIAPMLVKYVVVDLSTNLLFRYRNKNVSKANSDNSQPIDFREMEYLMSSWRNKAEFLKQRLIDYLCANSSKFPEYLNCEYWELIPETQGYTTPFNLDSETWEQKRERLRLRGSL